MMDESVGSLGEFGLIGRIHRLIEEEGVTAHGLSLGIGDDCAAFIPRAGFEVLVTCDSMVEDRHYLARFISSHDLGRRAMILNISDIGSMGGSPLYALVSLGLKPETPVAEIEAMYRGFLAELNPFNASIIGGNITKTMDKSFIDVTLIGEVERGRMVRRSTARTGDAILVTGCPGRSAAGLQMLLNASPSEDLSNDPLVRAYNTPSHRAREGKAVSLSGCATAMIDTSDGFAGDLGHILDESGVGAELVSGALPTCEDLRGAAERMGKDPRDFLLGESDDYELIVTCRPEHVEDIRAAVRAVSDVALTEVGRIIEPEGGLRLVEPDGTTRTVSPAGWDHFKGGRGGSDV